MASTGPRLDECEHMTGTQMRAALQAPESLFLAAARRLIPLQSWIQSWMTTLC